jgi:hypothetical protein
VVGKRGKDGAIVFGIYSFIDKSLVGLTVFVVTHSDAYANTEELTPEQKDFMRLTVTGIPAVACVLGTLAVLCYPIPEYHGEKEDEK